MKSGVIRGGAIDDAHCGDGAKAEIVYPKPLAHKLTSKYVKQIEKKLETYGENPTIQYTIATKHNFRKKSVSVIRLLKISGMIKLKGRPDEISAK